MTSALEPLDLPAHEYVANISIMFTEVELLDRPRAARAAGFSGIECWWPFTEAVPDDGQVETFLKTLEQAEVRLTGLNFFAGDMPAGERGIACRPDRAAELIDSTEVLIMIAERTGCRYFNLLYGQYDDRWTEAEQRRTAISAIRRAAERVAAIDGTVLLEPLASPLNGNYPLKTADDVITVLDGPLAGLDNVGLLFDLFHLGANGVDLVAEAERQAGRIAHVQIADHPGRAEPGTGSLPIAETVRTLWRTGYRGRIGCEYKPSRKTEETLGWLPAGALDDHH